jgi:predicted CoA-binding protein
MLDMGETRELIEELLRQKRIAVVGVSRNPRHFSSGLLRELRQRGYEAVPVNPNVAEIDGLRCFARAQDITPPVEGAFLLTTPQVSEQVLRDCAEAGIRLVWMLRASPAAMDFCRSKGIRAVAGYCPYLFLPGAAWFHRLHGFFMKIGGRYPQ